MRQKCINCENNICIVPLLRIFESSLHDVSPPTLPASPNHALTVTAALPIQSVADLSYLVTFRAMLLNTTAYIHRWAWLCTAASLSLVVFPDLGTFLTIPRLLNMLEIPILKEKKNLGKGVNPWEQLTASRVPPRLCAMWTRQFPDISIQKM